jgi:SNF2 family DNA or RNA helicase
MKYNKVKHSYQEKAKKFLLSSPESGLFLDMGLGKTAIILEYIIEYKKQNPTVAVLIVAPLRVVYEVWPVEIQKWDEFQHLTFQILHGAKKQTAILQRTDIYLINPEGLFWFFTQKSFACQILIIDESTKFKNWSSKRMKLLRKFLHNFQRRHILTGTPAANSLQDLFAQVYILDLGKALGKFITQYRNQYFYTKIIPGVKVPLYLSLPASEKEIYSKIKNKVLRMDAKDYLALPDLIQNDIHLTLDAKTEKIYRSMEKEFFSCLKDEVIFAKTKVANMLKCRQILSGAVYNEKNKYTTINKIKLMALRDIIESLGGQQALIIYEFKHELDRFFQEFGRDIKYIAGGVSKNELKDTLLAWNAKSIQVLFGHPKAMGHGLNLQGGHHLVWFSLTWSLDEYLQVNARIHRQGQKEKVFVHRLIFRNTLDEFIAEKLRKKEKVQEKLFKHLLNYQKTKGGKWDFL